MPPLKKYLFLVYVCKKDAFLNIFLFIQWIMPVFSLHKTDKNIYTMIKGTDPFEIFVISRYISKAIDIGNYIATSTSVWNTRCLLWYHRKGGYDFSPNQSENCTVQRLIFCELSKVIDLDLRNYYLVMIEIQSFKNKFAFCTLVLKSHKNISTSKTTSHQTLSLIMSIT